jgi:prepilin peptidase CpaA
MSRAAMLLLIALTLYVAALAAAAVSDLVRYEIPNIVGLALIAGFALLVPVLPLAIIGAHMATAAAVFVVTALAFAFRIVGGGDAKLLAATALWMGWRDLPAFLLLTALAGALLGLALLLLRWLIGTSPVEKRWYSRLLTPREGVPYGVAIAVAGLALVPRLGADLLR